MNCIHCSALFESTNPVYKCPYCGGLNQIAPVVLAQDLRIETINDTASVIIPKWTPLPTGNIQSFSTGLDNQQAVSVHILQGNHEKLGDNRDVGLFVFDGITPAPRGVPLIQFTFEIGEDGILLVTAENQNTGRKLTFPRMYLDILKKAG